MDQKNNLNDIKSLVLWATDDCNLRCKYCYADSGEKKQYMTFATAKKVIDRMGENFTLQFAGGEPLMNLNLIRGVYDYIREKGIGVKLQIQTNGALITPEIAREIKNMKIAVGVSLDGSAEINENLRGKTRQVIEGMRNLAEEGIYVNINCVVTGYNVGNLPKLVDMALYFGNIKGIGLDLLRESERASRLEIPQASPSHIRDALFAAYERTLELKKAFGRNIVIREIEDGVRRLNSGQECKAYCYASIGGSMVVLPNGELYPCGSFANKAEYRMGNIEDEKINIISLKDDKGNECRDCKYKNICRGGCSSRVIINSGENGYSPQDCALRKTAFEIAELRKSNTSNYKGGK